MPTVHLIIKGKVQHVFYRVSAKDEAEKLGLTGWIKNTPEGNVEVMASGSRENIDRFIAWCWKGPSRAQVKSIMINEMDADRQFDEFKVIRGH